MLRRRLLERLIQCWQAEKRRGSFYSRRGSVMYWCRMVIHCLKGYVFRWLFDHRSYSEQQQRGDNNEEHSDANIVSPLKQTWNSCCCRYMVAFFGQIFRKAS